MTKNEFFAELRERLSGLDEHDVQGTLAYWNEMIDDRMEDGMSETDAVEAIGTPAEIAAQVLGDAPFTKQAKPQAKKRRRLHGGEIALLILGAPLWIALLVAAAAVVLSLYVSVWAVIISLWAAAVSVTLTPLPMLAYSMICLIGGDAASFLLWIGAALLLFGIGLFLIVLCRLISKGTCTLTVRLLQRKKPLPTGKECEQ